jgi:Flp pilus assembly protein protease CpaA
MSVQEVFTFEVMGGGDIYVMTQVCAMQFNAMQCNAMQCLL